MRNASAQCEISMARNALSLGRLEQDLWGGSSTSDTPPPLSNGAVTARNRA